MEIVVVSVFEDGMDELHTFRDAWEGDMDEEEALIKTLSVFTGDLEVNVRHELELLHGSTYGLHSNPWVVATVIKTQVKPKV